MNRLTVTRTPYSDDLVDIYDEEMDGYWASAWDLDHAVQLMRIVFEVDTVVARAALDDLLDPDAGVEAVSFQVDPE